MVYGAILDTGQEYFTDMHTIMHGLGDVGPRHNWLITDWTCYAYPPEMREDVEWKTGAELMQMLDRALGVQWVWGVFSGFEPHITKEQVMQYSVPYADGNAGFWTNPLTIQHPLASVEIDAFDGSFTLLFSREKKICDDFRAAFPLSKDLSEVNASYHNGMKRYGYQSSTKHSAFD